MRKLLVFMSMVLSSAGAVFAAESVVTVFGLPLGGKMPPLKICTIDEISALKIKNHCWISKPFTAKDGSKLGTLNMADSDALPEWAAYASFSASLSPTGALERLNVEAPGTNKKQAIASSISKRFGLPISTTLPRSDLAEARWISQGIEINQLCIRDQCQVSFSSSSSAKKMADAQAEENRINKARPASP